MTLSGTRLATVWMRRNVNEEVTLVDVSFFQRKKRSEEKQRRIRSSTVTVRIRSVVEAEAEAKEDGEEEGEGEVILGPGRAIIRRREREMRVHGEISIYV